MDGARRRTGRLAGLLAATLLALPGPEARAQEAPVRLSLNRALELARDANPQYRRALNQVDLNDPAGKAAWGAFLPSLSVSAGTQQTVSRRTISEDIFGQPIENEEIQTNWNSSSSQGISLGMDLFRGRNWYGMGQTRAESLERTRGAETAWVTLFARVEREFYEAQRLAALLVLERDLLDDKVRDLEVAQRLYSLATNTRADVLAAELDLQRQEQRVEEARGSSRSARLNLRTTLGRPDFDDFELEPAPLTIFDPALLAVDSLVGRAMSANPVILQSEAATAVRSEGLSASKSDRWPTISLNANLGRSELGADQTGLFSLLPTDQYSGAVGLQVNWPVFQRFGTSYQIAQAEVTLRNAQESLREIRLEVERDVRNRIIQLESAFRAVELSRASLALADERLRLAREEYSLGTRSYEELQIAVSQRDASGRDFLNAEYQFVVARINLEEALAGRLDDEVVETRRESS